MRKMRMKMMIYQMIVEMKKLKWMKKMEMTQKKKKHKVMKN
jgi:hypothetical protein